MARTKTSIRARLPLFDSTSTPIRLDRPHSLTRSMITTSILTRTAVFWMIQVDEDAVEVDLTKGKLAFRQKILRSLTTTIWRTRSPTAWDSPAPWASRSSRVSSRNVPPSHSTSNGIGITATAEIHNSSQTFQGSFLSTPATIPWSAVQPGFQYQSEAPNPSRSLFSVLGGKQNGVFFL